MKPIVFSLLFLFISKVGFSQISADNDLIISPDDKLVYLDSSNIETKSKNYAYIRVIKDFAIDKENYTIEEYYRSGEKRLEGSSKTKDGYSKEGETISYYKNGTKKSLANYSKGRLNGNDFEWYENGNKKLEGTYIEDEKKRSSQHTINQFWDKNGTQTVINGNGFLDDKGEDESSKGEIKNGVKNGYWEGNFLKSKLSYQENYKEGKLISGQSTDKDNQSYSYTEVETKPEPRNGIMDFYQYIGKNYRIPKDLPKGSSGKIYIKFVVDKDGKIVEPNILRDLGYGTGEEAIRVLNNCEKWEPGIQRGRKVRCTYSLPISIQTANLK